MTVIAMFIMPFSSQAVQKVNPRLWILFGGSIGLISLLLSSFVKPDGSFYLWFVLFSGGYGTANGCLYILPIHYGWKWYPEKPGLISGIIIANFGLGALIFDNVATSIVNPTNLPF